MSLVISFVAAQRGSRSVFLRACSPVLLLVLVAVVYGVTERPPFVPADTLLGRMRRSEALSLSRSLCARITGTPVDASSVTGYTNPLMGDPGKRWHEWQVVCRTGDYQYTFRISADRREVLIIHREKMSDSSPKPDIRLDEEALLVSGRNEAERAAQGRRYLALAGLPAPAKSLVRSQGGYDFTYRVACQPSGVQGDEQKRRRLLRVSLDPEDGSLVSLQNSIYRKYVQHPQAALAPAAKTPVGD